MLRRLPIESAQPVVIFAVARLVLAAVAFFAVVLLGFPYGGGAAAVLGLLAIPWAAANVVLARRAPERALSVLVAAGDFVVLIVLEIVEPQLFGAIRVAALFLVASHAHFQGERRGIAVAALGAGSLVAATLLHGDEPVDGGVLAVYESVFAASALATALVVGMLRTAESASRMRARDLSRRTLQAESEIRRRVAESIHDGPVQELIGLDMILAAAGEAATSGREAESARLIGEARELTTRNVRALRDEIVDLGPSAFRELAFETAVEECLPVWKRRYAFEVMATIERIPLPPEMAGDLFRIAQEAIVNAGRHSHAEAVSLSLRTVGSDVELRVTDNGGGFGNGDPLGASEPGHLGLASMRERAELLGGVLDIETSPKGTRVLVRTPLPARS